jgi:hypothetical protein
VIRHEVDPQDGPRDGTNGPSAGLDVSLEAQARIQKVLRTSFRKGTEESRVPSPIIGHAVGSGKGGSEEDGEGASGASLLYPGVLVGERHRESCSEDSVETGEAGAEAVDTKDVKSFGGLLR